MHSTADAPAVATTWRNHTQALWAHDDTRVPLYSHSL